MTKRTPPPPEASGADDVRAEMSARLKALAGPGDAGESVKSQISRAARRLSHPELTPGAVKRLWYGEVNVFAHIADHIRAASTAGSDEGFVIDADGRIRARAVPGDRPPVVVGLGRELISVELRPSGVSAGGLGSLRHWLLSMMADGRAFRVIDVDRATMSGAKSALIALDRVEEAMTRAPGRTSSLIEGMAMIADKDGVRPLDEAVLSELGISPVASYDVACYLARNLDVVVFQPIAGRIDVLAKARGAASEAVRHARAWLGSIPGPARLRILWGDGWLSELAGTGSQAAARLVRLVALERGSEKPPDYLSRRIRLADVPAIEMEPLVPMLGILSRGFDQEIFGELINRKLAQRLWVIGVDDGRATFNYIPVGPDYYGRNFFLDAIGRRISDQPDQRYGEAVERSLVEAANDQEPHFERVQARIREHADDGTAGEVRIASYGRLVVPIEGKRVVTVSSLTPPPAAA